MLPYQILSEEVELGLHGAPAPASRRAQMSADKVDLAFEAAVQSQGRGRPDLALLSRLLQEGAHIDGVERNGMPLRHAITTFSLPLISFLLTSGADPNASLRSRAGLENQVTPLHWATHRFKSSHSYSLDGHLPVRVILELIASGADTDRKNNSGVYPGAALPLNAPILIFNALSRPLHAAIEIKDPLLCIRLLERGIDPNVKNGRRQTAWRHAELSMPDCAAAMRSWEAGRAIEKIFSAPSFPKP